MDIKDLINYEPFFKMYKHNDIVYPNAVARHFSISKKEANELCAARDDLFILYMIKCPVCNRTLPTRYYSLVSIDTDVELGCDNCCTEFLPNIEEDVMVYFEKK